MDLLVDIGNTSLKWTLCTLTPPLALEPMRVIRHHGGLPIDLLAAWGELASPSHLRVSCVGPPQVARSLSRVAQATWGLEPEFVHTRPVCAGLTIAYADPGRLGVDRWLALLAAHHLYDKPLLIIDAGTAITYDLLLANGRHLGGLILPGIEAMRQTLLANTHIPYVEPEEMSGTWAQDTASAIAIASLEAPAALAERLLQQLSERVGAMPLLIVTGSDAGRLQSRIPTATSLHIPDLVLQGLARVAE